MAVDRGELDRPEVTRFVFHPRQGYWPPPPGAQDLPVAVETGLFVSTRFYHAGKGDATILFFHGNGEIVAEYDEVAPLYTEQGLNLLVADYRGYGASGGTPAFSNMLDDAHTILTATLRFLGEKGYSSDLFVMGRSLGSASAIELAADHPDMLRGLVVESGYASGPRLLQRLGLAVPPTDEKIWPNPSTISRARVPTLIIHGELDMLIPVSEGRELYRLSPAPEKRLLIIPRAGHNDILLVDTPTYMAAIRDFVAAHRS